MNASQQALLQQLDAREQQLQEDLGAVRLRDAPAEGHEVGDRKDEADARTQQLVGSAELERDLAELRLVQRARERVLDGSWGLCIDCDAEIASARLAAQPTAQRCLACQTHAEQQTLATAPR